MGRDWPGAIEIGEDLRRLTLGESFALLSSLVGT
jgi:hypothetical protein